MLSEEELPYRAIYITGADMDADEQLDIVAGGWWYKNPGKAGEWKRNTIGSPLN